MIKEIIKVESGEDERPFHLLVTRESTDREGLEEVAVSFIMDQEQRAALVEHLANIADIEDAVGFSITFSVNSIPDSDNPDALGIFSRSIKSRL